MKHPFIIWPLLALVGLASVFTVEAAPTWAAPPAQQQQGQFWRWHWYERGLTNANPAYESRFWANLGVGPEQVIRAQRFPNLVIDHIACCMRI